MPESIKWATRKHLLIKDDQPVAMFISMETAAFVAGTLNNAQDVESGRSGGTQPMNDRKVENKSKKHVATKPIDSIVAITSPAERAEYEKAEREYMDALAGAPYALGTPPANETRKEVRKVKAVKK